MIVFKYITWKLLYSSLPQLLLPLLLLLLCMKYEYAYACMFVCLSTQYECVSERVGVKKIYLFGGNDFVYELLCCVQSMCFYLYASLRSPFVFQYIYLFSSQKWKQNWLYYIIYKYDNRNNQLFCRWIESSSLFFFVLSLEHFSSYTLNFSTFFSSLVVVVILFFQLNWYLPPLCYQRHSHKDFRHWQFSFFFFKKKIMSIFCLFVYFVNFSCYISTCESHT